MNAEPRGSVELDWLPTLDLRAGRFFHVGRNRLELSVDVYNATNANTVFSVRTNTGTANIRVDGDPAAPTTTDQCVPVAERSCWHRASSGSTCRENSASETVTSAGLSTFDRAFPGRRRCRRRPGPVRKPRRRSSSSRVSSSRVPVMPSGWPSAIAPPFTLTFSRSSPSSFSTDRYCAAKASLISIRSMSSERQPRLLEHLARRRRRPHAHQRRLDANRRPMRQAAERLRAHARLTPCF